MATTAFEVFDLNSAKEWKQYVGRFQQYMKSQRVAPDLYTSSLISSVTNRVYGIMCDLCHPDKPEDKQFDELVEKLTNHFGSNRTVVAARYVFRKREQKPGENITDFIQQLRLLAQTCGFRDKLEENLRDQLAAGVTSEDIRRSLFLEQNLTFAQAKEIALGMEAAAKACNVGKENIKNNAKIQIVNKKYALHNTRCPRCGRVHEEENECPYLQFRCNNCQEKGHLAKMCSQAPSTSFQYYGKRKDYVKRRYRTRYNAFFGTDSESDSSVSVHIIKVGKKKNKRI